MKVRLNKTCSFGKEDEIIDVEEFEDARRMVITGVASEIPDEPDLQPAAKKKTSKKKTSKKKK